MSRVVATCARLILRSRSTFHRRGWLEVLALVRYPRVVGHISRIRRFGLAALLLAVACGGSDSDNGGGSGGAGQGGAPVSGGGMMATTGGTSAGTSGTSAPAPEEEYTYIDLCDRDMPLRDDAAKGVTVLAEGLESADRLRANATHIFFASFLREVIVRVPKEGGEAEILVEGHPTLRIAVDDQFLYWIENRDDKTSGIFKFPLDKSSEPEMIYDGLPPLDFPEVDGTGLYFANREAQILYRLSLDGSELVELVSAVTVQGMALHDGFVYFTDYNRSAIMRVPTVGGEGSQLATSFFPGDIDADESGVYYAGSFDTVETVPLTGGESKVLVNEEGFTDSTDAVRVEGGQVFWRRGDFGCRPIHRLNIDGSNRVIYSLPEPSEVLLEPGVFYASVTSDTFGQAAQIVRIERQ